MLAHIATFVVHAISQLGYLGVAALMAIESACIPLPSEIIMPFSGYLVATGRFSLWAVAAAGAAGSVVGSWGAYALGAWGGRPLIERYGRYLLISRNDLDRADRWFERRGDLAVLVGRVLPVVRTFIGFPAGVARMDLVRFSVYTFVGSYVWCFGLAWIGKALGERWDTLGSWFHRADALIVALGVAAVAYYVVHHLRSWRAAPGTGADED